MGMLRNNRTRGLWVSLWISVAGATLAQDSPPVPAPEIQGDPEPVVEPVETPVVTPPPAIEPLDPDEAVRQMLQPAEEGEAPAGGASLLVVLPKENALVFLDPVTGKEQSRVPVGLNPREVRVSPDGELAVVANEGIGTGVSSLSVVDLRTRRLQHTLPLQIERHDPEADTPELRVTVERFMGPRGLCFTPDAKRVLVTCEGAHSLLLVDLVSGSVIAAIDTEQERPSQVLLDRDGRRAFVSNERSGSISVIDLSRRRLEQVLETGGGAHGLALHPMKDELWVANFETNSISVVDTKTLEERIEFPCGTYPVRLQFTNDGQQLWCVNYQGGSVSVFDAETRRLVQEVALERVSEDEALERPLQPHQQSFGRSSLPVSLQASRDGNSMWVVCTRSDRIGVIDVKQLQVTNYISTSPHPRGLAWTSTTTGPQLAK